MKKEHKYKDKDNYKDNDKDKHAERITETLTVCYISRHKPSKMDGQSHQPGHPGHEC